MEKSVINKIRWVTRLLGASLVLFILASAIVDTIEGDPKATGKIAQREIPLFIAMISMFVGFIVAWLREGIGGLLIIGGFIFFYAFHLIFFNSFPRGLLFIIFLIIGLVFLFCWWQSRKKVSQAPRKNVSK
jgi:hypothetical protein